MKRLKKLLAISLVLIMMMGMVPFAGASAQALRVETIYDFVDADDIYHWEAVAVLTATRILRGDEGQNRFRPNDTLTRAEAAAIISRVNLAAHVADMLPAAPTGFSDVPATHWAARYVAFAVEQGIIVGHPDGTFRPDDNVTGTQFAAMLLRSLGYGALGEFEGPAWELNVMITATARQQQFPGFVIPWLRDPILAGNADFTAPATREEVAFYALNAMRWNDVLFGTDVAAGLVTQTYMTQPTVMMTRVHQMVDPTQIDNFGRPFTNWRWIPPGRTVLVDLGVEIPHAPAVQWTSRQTSTAVGVFVRDNPFVTPGQTAVARALTQNGRPIAGGISTVSALHELTNNGVVVEVYLDPATGYINRVVAIQTDLYRVQTVDAANQRVVLNQTSSDRLTALIGGTFNVTYDPVALDNDMYDYVRALPAGGEGTGTQVLVVPVWDTAALEFVPYSIQRPVVIEGILERINFEEFRVTLDGELYSLAMNRHNTINDRAIPHATNIATLFIDNHGFVVDLRTEPRPDRVHHMFVLQSNLSIPRPGPGGTVINHPAVRAITSYGNEVVVEAVVAGSGLQAVSGVLYAVTGVSGTVYQLTPLVPETVPAVTVGGTPAPHLSGVALTGEIPARSVRLTYYYMQEHGALFGGGWANNQFFNNHFHGSIQYIYVWQVAGVWRHAVRTGPQPIIDLDTANWATAVIQDATPAGAARTNLVRAIFIQGSPGAPQPSELIHIANINPLGAVMNDVSSVEAWRGHVAVGGGYPRGLDIRGIAGLTHNHRFYFETDVDGVAELTMLTENFVSNARVVATPGVPAPNVIPANPNQITVSGGHTDGTVAGTFIIPGGAQIVDTRRADDIPANHYRIMNLTDLRNAARNFEEVRVSFAYLYDDPGTPAPIIFVSYVRVGDEVEIPEGDAVFLPQTIEFVREVPHGPGPPVVNQFDVVIRLGGGYTFNPIFMLNSAHWAPANPLHDALLITGNTVIQATTFTIENVALNAASTEATLTMRFQNTDGTAPPAANHVNATVTGYLNAVLPDEAVIQLGAGQSMLVAGRLPIRVVPVTAALSNANVSMMRPAAGTNQFQVTLRLTGTGFNAVLADTLTFAALPAGVTVEHDAIAAGDDSVVLRIVVAPGAAVPSTIYTMTILAAQVQHRSVNLAVEINLAIS